MKKIVILCLPILLTACLNPKSNQHRLILKNSTESRMAFLKGKTTQDISNILGQPAIVRTENPNQTWVFRGNNCSLFVFFNQDEVGHCESTCVQS